MGYVVTNSGTQQYMKDNPDCDLLKTLNQELVEVYKMKNRDLQMDDIKITMTSPMFLLMGRP